MKKWIVDFNGMSTHPGLFYANSLGDHIYIYIFCVAVSVFSSIANNFQTHEFIDWSQTGTITPCQSGPGSNS